LSSRDSAHYEVEDLEQDVQAQETELQAARAAGSADGRDHARRGAARGDLTSRGRARQRDDALNALADARSILAQLAGGVGGDANDPPSIVQAVLANRDSQLSEREQAIDALRGDLSRRDARIAQLERWLNEARDTTPGDAPIENSEH
jgi:hypothetical protein